jgi:hypothetical protein
MQKTGSGLKDGFSRWRTHKGWIYRFVTGCFFKKRRILGVWLKNCRWLFDVQMKVPGRLIKTGFSGGWSSFFCR